MARTNLPWLAMHFPDGTCRALVLVPGEPHGLARRCGGSVRASLVLHVINNGMATALNWLSTGRREAPPLEGVAMERAGQLAGQPPREQRQS
jgi:hypothetical protein